MQIGFCFLSIDRHVEPHVLKYNQQMSLFKVSAYAVLLTGLFVSKPNKKDMKGEKKTMTLEQNMVSEPTFTPVSGNADIDLEYEPEQTDLSAIGANGISASDASSLVGLNSYAPGSLVMARKLGMADYDHDDDSDMWFAVNQACRAPLIKRFARTTGLHCELNTAVFRHPLYPWMMAKPDGFVRLATGEIAPIVCKFYSPTSPWVQQNDDDDGIRWKSGVYGEDGKLGNERNVAAAEHICAVMNAGTVMFLATSSFRGDDMQIVAYKRNLSLEKEIINAEGKAWNAAMEDGELPDDGDFLSDTAYDAIVRSFASPDRVRAEAVDLTTDTDAHEAVEKINDLNDRLKGAKKAVKDITEQLNAQKAVVIEAMAGHEAARCGDFYISFKGTHRVTVDSKKLKAQYPEIYDAVAKDTVTAPSLKIKEKR